MPKVRTLSFVSLFPPFGATKTLLSTKAFLAAHDFTPFYRTNFVKVVPWKSHNSAFPKDNFWTLSFHFCHDVYVQGNKKLHAYCMVGKIWRKRRGSVVVCPSVVIPRAGRHWFRWGCCCWTETSLSRLHYRYFLFLLFSPSFTLQDCWVVLVVHHHRRNINMPRRPRRNQKIRAHSEINHSVQPNLQCFTQKLIASAFQKKSFSPCPSSQAGFSLLGDKSEKVHEEIMPIRLFVCHLVWS